MAYKIELKPEAADELRSLDKEVGQRILSESHMPLAGGTTKDENVAYSPFALEGRRLG